MREPRTPRLARRLLLRLNAWQQSAEAARLARRCAALETDLAAARRAELVARSELAVARREVQFLARAVERCEARVRADIAKAARVEAEGAGTY